MSSNNSPSSVSQNQERTRLPVFFIGHGSPMNALADNEFTKVLTDLGQEFKKPKAVLVISAHWMTEGSWVTAMSAPKTIHDFYGFPQALFDIDYPAPGSPEVAQQMSDSFSNPSIHMDTEMWGLDHGTWSVLKHMYPKAQVPVLQLSLSLSHPPEYHYELGKQLSKLRNQGVLIVGSGNLVHNLRQIKWEPGAKPYDWAVDFDNRVRKDLTERNFESLLYDFHKTPEGKLSIPTLEHYLPLHYILGAADKVEQLKFEYEELENGSISMRSFRLG